MKTVFWVVAPTFQRFLLLSSSRHGATTQKTVIFILAAGRSSNLRSIPDLWISPHHPTFS
jgi:hypothetical protein